MRCAERRVYTERSRSEVNLEGEDQAPKIIDNQLFNLFFRRCNPEKDDSESNKKQGSEQIVAILA
jgi:hypothetical protein